MELSKKESRRLLFECATETVGGTDQDQVENPSKLGMVLMANGIDPFLLSFSGHLYADNVLKAGKFFKGWGELLLREEKKDA